MNWDDIGFALAIYFVIWWIVIFAVLPFGVKTQAEEGEVTEGTSESAPSQYNLGKVLRLNTLVSLVIFAILLGIRYGLGIDLEYLSEVMPALT